MSAPSTVIAGVTGLGGVTGIGYLARWALIVRVTEWTLRADTDAKRDTGIAILCILCPVKGRKLRELLNAAEQQIPHPRKMDEPDLVAAARVRKNPSA